MKRLLLLLFVVVAFSACSSDDDNADDLLFDYAPIGSVEIPTTFVLGEEYEIKITFTYPSPCHKMFGFEYVPENDTHYFGIVTTYDPNDPLCSDEVGTTEEYIWKFRANRNENYIFKFWAGTDSNGEAVFLTKEVQVIQ